MDFVPSDDQQALGDELRRLLAGACDPDTRRAAMDLPGAVDRSLWSTLAETGVFSLTLPEVDGGVGLGRADATIVFEELGRAAVPGPFIWTSLAAGLVDGAADGTVVVGGVEPRRPLLVEHLGGVDAVLVVEPDAVRCVPAAELSGRLMERPTDPLTPVTLVESLPEGTVVGDAGAAERLRLDGALLVAATQIGLGAACLDLAVAYAKERHQFGKPIGAFQAVKHMCADAYTGVELARAAVQAAGVEIDEGASDDVTRRAVAAARIVASHAALAAGKTCVQVHGGMGFTWELDAHLFLKRSLVLDTLVGNVDASVDQMATVLA